MQAVRNPSLVRSAAPAAARPAFALRAAAPTSIPLLAPRALSTGLRAHVPKPRRVAARAAQPSVVATAEVEEETGGWEGADLKLAAIAIGVGLLIRFAIPCPAGLTMQSWTLLATFVSTIVGLVLEPLPVGAWAWMGLTVVVLTKTLTFADAFVAFGNDVIWLIVVSFFFAKGFDKTGLGERVANLFVRALGKSTLGLAYGLAAAETIISPAMPSTSARAGGVFMPIIKSLSSNVGSEPGPSAKKLGAFLVLNQMHAGNHSSVLFLTGAAQNLLCLKLAEAAGVFVANAWPTWLMGALVPGVIGAAVTPYILYKMVPPEITDTPDAPAEADKKLKELGPLTKDQSIMLATMGLAVTLWIGGDALGVPAVVAAMIGLCILLFTGVVKWKECLDYNPAWDTLTWFAVLIAMSSQLNSMGVIKYFADAVGVGLTSLNLAWPTLFALLHLAYFYLHYLFASQTAHVGALFSAFLALMLAAGVPGPLAALSLAYNTNLFGAITHFGSGQAAVYFGSGYLETPDVFKVGFVLSVITLGIWFTTGAAWWKILGWM